MSGWQTRAACKDADPDTFYPPGDTYPQWAVDEAKKWCDRCPVLNECLESNLAETHGIFARTTPEDRKRIRGRRERARRIEGVIGDKRALNPPKVAKSAQCPEPGRYRSVVRHQSLGQQLCVGCALFDADQARMAELDRRVSEFLAEGYGPSAIGRELGLHRDVVSGVIRRLRKRELEREVAA